jgi:hypothetical protein
MLNEDNDDNTWTSCCLKVDRSAVIFFSQLSISIGVIAFCLFQLIHLTECEQQTTYSSLLTLILGTWMPNPRILNKKQDN